ncbi:MAG: TonB-dependent receptor [Hyphomicrobium sp.]|jgi:iron complex outermembrane receptor protein
MRSSLYVRVTSARIRGIRDHSLKAAAGGLAVCLSLPLAAEAQQATTELPPIEVTTPSPVKRAPKKQVSAPSNSPVSGASQPLPQQVDTAAFQPPPGTLIVSTDAFVSVTVATERDLHETGGATITDTLQTKPGITGSNFAAGANRPIIRGLDNYRVRVQEDGIGTHDVSALSEDHAVPIDPNAADRVEVVRGPATLRYGSQAIGGVVSAENDRIPDAIPRGGIAGEVFGGYSSVDEGKDGGFKVTAGGAGFAVHADGYRRDADDYDTPQGRQENTFVKSNGGSVGLSRIWDDGFVGVAYSRFESLYGIPGTEAVEENSRISMVQDKVLAKGEWRPHAAGIEAARFWFGASDYAHNELVDEGDVGSRFTNKEQEGRVEVQHVPVATSLGELHGAAGVQIGHRELTALSFEGGDSLLEPNTTHTTAGFIFEELQATRHLRFQGAARIERSHVEGSTFEDIADPGLGLAAFDKSYTPVSASIGTLYELPMNVVARLTAQYVERAPDAGELFSKGVHEATGTFEIGDPNLAKEKARTVEIGLKRSEGAFRFDTSAYYTVFDGFIFKELTGEMCDDELSTCGSGSELKQVIFQQRDATFYGVELAGEYDVARVWRGIWGISGQYDFVRAEFSDGENVPRIPPHRLGGGVYYRDMNWAAAVSLLHAFNQDEIGFGETPTAGYTLLGATVSYTMPATATRPEVTVGLKGDNLLNDDVRNAVSFKKDEVLEPGASVRLFGSVKLN